MHRSIQIVSACALILVVAGLGTGVSEGLAAEGETLPCNNFCRTWMGYEAGERTAPPVRSDETVTAKPSEVKLDPELAVDHSAPKIAFTTDSGDKLHRPKPKRKGERETADASNRRSVATQSKTSKLGKTPVSHDEVLSDSRSGSESSRNRPPDQGEEDVRKPSMMRSETLLATAKVTTRAVPLPPRLPRGARPDRSGVAQAGSIAADQIRTRVVDERQAKPSMKADVTAGSNVRNAAELDVSHLAPRSMISVAAKPTAKTVDIGSDGAAEGTAVAPSPGLSVMPAIDPRGAEPGVTRETSLEHTLDSTKSSATQTLAGNGPRIEAAPTIGVVAHASDPSTSAVAPKSAARPPASAAAGEAASKILPNAVGQQSAVAAEGPVGSQSPAGRAFVPGFGSDKDAAQVALKAAAPSSPSLALEESTAKNPPKSADNGSAISAADTTVVVPPVPKGRIVGPASDTDKQAALVASPAEAPHTASRVSGRAALIGSPDAVDQGSQVAADAAAKPKATSAATSTGAARAGNDDGIMRPASAPSSQPARAATASEVARPEQAPVYPPDTHVAALNEVQTMSAPLVSQSPAELPNANRAIIPDLDSKAEEPRAGASSSTNAPIRSRDMPLVRKDDASRANPGETASMVMARPPGAASDNPATLVTISVNDVSAQPEKTTIAYTIMNLAASPVDILFIRCNAVDPRGAIVGSVLDYVVSIPAGQEVKRFVHMSNDFASGQTFSCANDAATH